MKKSHHMSPGLAPEEPPREDHDHDYSALLASVQRSFERVATGARRVFTTNAADLNELYLDSLPSERQVHNCHACRTFIQRYGGLVTIDGKTGETTPLMWHPEDVPEFYHGAFEALDRAVRRARVTGVFSTAERVWGTPKTGLWRHMAVTPDRSLVHGERALAPHQRTAATAENYRTVRRALAEFSPEMLEQALRVLESGAVSRAEKFTAPVRWLLDLHRRPKGELGENLLWLAVACAVPLGLARWVSYRAVVALDRKGAMEEHQRSILRDIEGIVLLDGTWSQAKALWWRNAWMLKCQRVILGPQQPSRYGKLRREPRRDGLSTIEAAGMLMAELEQRSDIAATLNASFDGMLAKYRQAQSEFPEFRDRPKRRRDYRRRKKS